MTELIQISTIMNSKEGANEISRKLLGERVASCVQALGPVQGSYWWKGRVKHAQEWTCFIKARANDCGKIEASVKKIHRYHDSDSGTPGSKWKCPLLYWRVTKRLASQSVGA